MLSDFNSFKLEKLFFLIQISHNSGILHVGGKFRKLEIPDLIQYLQKPRGMMMGDVFHTQ